MESQRAIHLPLPTSRLASALYLGARSRFASFRVAHLRRDLPHVDVTFDRSDPEGGSRGDTSRLPKAFFGTPRYTNLLHLMADLDSNCVVVLGRDRLDEKVAREKIKEWQEYQERKKNDTN